VRQNGVVILDIDTEASHADASRRVRTVDAAARVFIPVELVERLTVDDVGIDRPRTQVARAPKYDPELVDHDERLASLYGHYGYTLRNPRVRATGPWVFR
jgi:hypothetical protein